MKTCLQCSITITKGRSDKRFCSDKCRNNYNNLINYTQRLFTVTKSRAIKNNTPFNLTIEDFEIPRYCPVFGIPLFVSRLHPSNNSPSIDKIIPELGYVKGNTWIISMRANRLKSDLSKEELIMFCTTFLNKLNKPLQTTING